MFLLDVILCAVSPKKDAFFASNRCVKWEKCEGVFDFEYISLACKMAILDFLIYIFFTFNEKNNNFNSIFVTTHIKQESQNG